MLFRLAMIRFGWLPLLLLGLSSGSAVVSAADGSPSNWPEFRGPTGNGDAGSATLPLTWSEKEHVRWKTPIRGKAWSSPVCWGNQVWVTTAPEDGKKLYALGLDRQTGKVLHDIEVFDNPFPQYCIERNSYASSTPAIEAGRIYVHYGAHGTACLDTDSGKTLWARRDLPCYHHRGPASSPILYENLLILTFDGFDLQYVVALDKQTGETVWRRDRNIEYGTDNGDVKKAYGTPSVFVIDGQPQLISPSAGAAMALNPRTGEEIWRIKAAGTNVSARPLFGHGLLFLSTADGGFVHYAVRPGGHGDITGTHVAWKNTKGVPKHASHALHGDLIFMANEQGIMTCLEAKTGEVVWQKRVQGSFTASPIQTADRIYFSNEEGETLVIAPGREFKLLATNQLEHGCMASGAVSGNALLLRTTDALYCLE